jgi:hypothetical protein
MPICPARALSPFLFTTLTNLMASHDIEIRKLCLLAAPHKAPKGEHGGALKGSPAAAAAHAEYLRKNYTLEIYAQAVSGNFLRRRLDIMFLTEQKVARHAFMLNNLPHYR